LKIGVFGVALSSSPLMSQTGKLKFLDEMETVRIQSKALRDAGADLVVAVTHTDFARDLDIMRSRLVDVLLTGHDHDLRLVFDNRVVMVESGEEGQFVTAVDIFAASGARRQASGYVVAQFPHDRFRERDAGPRNDGHRPAPRGRALKELDVALGTTNVELDTRSASVRSHETVMGNIICDAIRHATGAQVGLTNGGSIRGNRLYPAGHVITRRDILGELPFGNRTVMVEIKGSDLKIALENSVSEIDNRAGRFPQVSGMRITVDAKAPVARGSRRWRSPESP